MPLLLIGSSIIYADRQKPYKIPFCFVVDAAVRVAIVYPYRFGYLSKHSIVSILSCYMHRDLRCYDALGNVSTKQIPTIVFCVHLDAVSLSYMRFLMFHQCVHGMFWHLDCDFVEL